jgi:hypothetical protein
VAHAGASAAARVGGGAPRGWLCWLAVMDAAALMSLPRRACGVF